VPPRRALLILTATIVEVAPVLFLAALIGVWDTAGRGAPALSPLALAAATLAGYAAARELARRQARVWAERVALIALAAIGVPLLLLGPGMADLFDIVGGDPLAVGAGAGALLFCGWRGTGLAREDILYDVFQDIVGAFERGLLIFFAALALAVMTGGVAGRRLAEDGWPGLVLFFLSGLCALSLARVEGEYRHEQANGADDTMADAGGLRWLGALFGAAAGILVAGLALVALFSPAAMAHLVAALGNALGAFGALLSPLGALVGALFGHGQHAAPPPSIQPGAYSTPPGGVYATRPGPAIAPPALPSLLPLLSLVATGLLLWYWYSAIRRAGAALDGGIQRTSLRPGDAARPWWQRYALPLALLGFLLLLALSSLAGGQATQGGGLLALLGQTVGGGLFGHGGLFGPGGLLGWLFGSGGRVVTLSPDQGTPVVIVTPQARAPGHDSGWAGVASGILSLLLIVAALAALGAGLWYAYTLARRRRGGTSGRGRTQRTPLPPRTPRTPRAGGQPGWWPRLLAWLAALWPFGRRRAAPVPAPPVAVLPATATPDALTVREMYRRLLRRGAALGHPRRPAETPREYLERLRRTPTIDGEEADLLTALYADVRYGDKGERPADIERATRAWERLARQ